MKDILRQIFVILSIVGTLIVNGLANGLPLNGLNTGQISDQFEVYFVPAGYVFSIWGLIYLALIAFGIFQALPSQRENPRLRATGWWIVLSGIANSTWIFLWHYEQFPLTVVVMLVLLVTLIVVYTRLGTGRTTVSTAEQWAVRLPFSLYLGWISVATVANISSLLDYIKWDRFGLSQEIWMKIMLVVVLALTVAMIFTRRDVVFAAVILWALAGIGFKHSAVPEVALPTWITFGLVVLALLIMVLGRKPGQMQNQQAL
jgi:hypothetical protein